MLHQYKQVTVEPSRGSAYHRPRLAALAFAVVTLTTAARAGAAGEQSRQAAEDARADIRKTLGFVPQFALKIPDAALPGAWEEMKTLQMNPKTALSGKTKELIGLAVAAQVPCRYCVYGHTEFAKLNGATSAELGEAVAMAGLTRHWSTVINGIQTDVGKFRADIGRVVETARNGKAAHAAKPAAVVDGQTALADITQSVGFVPDFLKRFPEAARAGAWREMKELQMNPKTALSGKDKELIGLAVAAQAPCQYCIIGHTEFARLNGATNAEIDEAIAMAALTRNMSTLLNGLEIDESQFRRDVDRLVKGAKAMAAKAHASASNADRGTH
jgi:AhpD family alkylhydroperoxidase